MYPTEEEIINLHKKYASSDALYELVTTHCTIVWKIAEQIIVDKDLALNKDLVKAGALLHDIGTYTFLALAKEHGEVLYYKHPMEGAALLRSEHLPEDLCNLVEHHLGVGLTKEEIVKQQMDLPLKDFTPQTIEERLVLYADKFHSKTPKFNSFQSYRAFISQFGEEQGKKFDALAQEFGIPDITNLAAQYKHPII